MMLLKVKVGNVVEHDRYVSASSRQIKSQPKLHGCTRRQMRLKVATISLKVTWSGIRLPGLVPHVVVGCAVNLALHSCLCTRSTYRFCAGIRSGTV